MIHKRLERVSTMPFEIYLYDIPKVTDDGKEVVPTKESESKSFDDLESALVFAREAKEKFDRVVVINSADGEQTLQEKFADFANK